MKIYYRYHVLVKSKNLFKNLRFTKMQNAHGSIQPQLISNAIMTQLAIYTVLSLTSTVLVSISLKLHVKKCTEHYLVWFDIKVTACKTILKKKNLLIQNKKPTKTNHLAPTLTVDDRISWGQQVRRKLLHTLGSVNLRR